MSHHDRKSKTRENRQSIINPDWNFEKMGIGGLDKEFSDIFRRAFASRVFPPEIVEQMDPVPSFALLTSESRKKQERKEGLEECSAWRVDVAGNMEATYPNQHGPVKFSPVHPERMLPMKPAL
ncbi:UNVERIFIED_CONTAM: hypothetical protein K2H54_002927 [Gekko kuhli]